MMTSSRYPACMTAIDLVEGPSLERAATGEMRRFRPFAVPQRKSKMPFH